MLINDDADAIDEVAPADGLAEPAEIDSAAQEAADARAKEQAREKERALVRTWWERTEETADFKAAVKQCEDDLLAIMGGTQAEIEDQAQITVNHIYRNTMQTVALTVPKELGVSWKPGDEAQVIPGMEIPPEMAQLLKDRKNKQLGVAEVTRVLMKRFGHECNLQEKVEAFVQDASHFRAAIFKVWYQCDLAKDPISEERLPDAQDDFATLRVMVQDYMAGRMSKDDARYNEMMAIMKNANKTQLEVKCGIVVELIPLSQYRVDPSVTAPEHHYTAGWERHDVYKTRDEVLASFETLSEEDLFCATVVTNDSAGNVNKQKVMDRKATSSNGAIRAEGARSDRSIKKDDVLVVAEIYDYLTNRRITLVEGVDIIADEQPLEKMPFGNSPFVLIVMNRFPDRLYGLSDTELQSKLQTAINVMRTNEETARDNAQPRWGFDPAAIGEKSLNSAKKAEPWSFSPVPVSGKGTLAESLVPLAGNHEYNAAEYDISRLLQEMRAMSMLPEQALGITGNADFAAEVNVAAAGANMMAKYRQSRISRALQRVFDKCAQLILWNVGVDAAVRYAGPLASIYWPKDQAQRHEVYETLRMSIDVQMDRALDYAKRADTMIKLLDVMARMEIPFDRDLMGKLLVKYFDLGDEGESLLKSDPNDLIQRLMLSLNENPSAVAPESMMQLAQAGQMAQQHIAQMAAQESAQGMGADPSAQQIPPTI